MAMIMAMFMMCLVLVATAATIFNQSFKIKFYNFCGIA